VSLVHSGPTLQRKVVSVKALLRLSQMAVVLLVGSTGASWSQEGIGSTVIVINTVEGTLAARGAMPVAQGDTVYRDEGVRTRVDSKAAILMEDKTNVSIGPSSTLKLDRFVYAGPNKSGTIILNVGKGTFRLIIGDANKRSYTILTPTAAIGIRG
jgi:hypothetical protein